MHVRRFLAIVALLAPLALAGCGDDPSAASSDLPDTKEEFIKEVRDSLDTELASQLKSTGADQATIDTALNSFLGCLYDDLKKDEDELAEVVADGGQSALATAVQKSMPRCGPKLTEALVGVAAEG